MTLIDDILAISLLDAGGLSHRFVETDLRKLTDAVVKDHQLTTRRHTISVKGPEALPVRADPTRLKQVLNNLLSNAIKYSPQGGPIEVRLRANPTDDTAMIYVRDHGIGIDPEDVPRLFDRFSRIQRKETSAIPGSGLGLYIAHQIVESHGGRLKLQPAPGKGTIAEVTVPLIVHDGEEDMAESPEPAEVGAGATRRRSRSANAKGNGSGDGAEVLVETEEHVVLQASSDGNGHSNGHSGTGHNGHATKSPGKKGTESTEVSPAAQETREEARTL